MELDTIDTKKIVRRQNLLILVDKYSSASNLNELTGRSRRNGTYSSILNRTKYGKGAGRYYVSDAMAVEIEKKLGLKAGWFDEEHPEEYRNVKLKKDLELAKRQTKKKVVKKDIRYENLKKLIAQYGSISKLNVATGRAKDTSTFSAILRGDKYSKGVGHYYVTERLARSIEQKLHLEEGWFDKEHPFTSI